MSQENVVELNRQKKPERKLELAEVLAELVRDGLVAKSDADKVLAQPQPKRRTDVHPLITIANHKLKNSLSQQKLLTLETLTAWLAKRANLPYQRIDPLKIDVASVTGLVSYAYAERFNILPLSVGQEHVIVATAEPYVTEWIKELHQVSRLKIIRVIANPADISRYLLEFYGLSHSVKRASGEKETTAQESEPIKGLSDLEQLVELGRAGKLDANDRHIVHIVDWLLQYAFDQRASDIHLEPRRDTSNIRFRIDGILHLVYQLPTPVMSAVTSRIKVLGRMDVAEKRRPQDGRLKTKTHQGREVELRLSVMPTAFGEKLVMRIFDPEVLSRTFENLGLTDEDLRQWTGMAEQPHGIVLVTGPTGSGKTTTLYSTLKHLAKPELNVCTVEDPIEMVEPRFNQMQVQRNIDLTFAGGVRTLLRQDPDIIMVGEIRDLETAEMAIQAALTGHLVLSTLHTNDSASAITRLLDIGVPYYLIRATLLGVMAQRLVRTLCPHCKQPGVVDDNIWNLVISPWRMEKPEQVFFPKGCPECRKTGYLGRVGIFEILRVTPSLAKFIQSDGDLEALREQGVREGMRPLRISGALKIAAGLTTAQEVFKVAPPRNDF